ncbi:hypothetical protein MSG28_015942 [Choristoneura fumiferana]|uniref:Uncharacterized protein n=1 Tax=Choristoneura fumiferana TaxID=7141 RepID=A0ACC0K5J4_CHOFU|nr:hypothetical protein MSG28_015942 [Choristoneura fumiferana]
MICLLPGCESRTGNKGKGQNITSFHRFPSLSSPVRQKWVEFVNRSQVGNWTLRKCHRLCSKHFSLDSFIVSNNNRVYLKDTAVPTIMLPHPTQTPASRCNPDGVVVPSTHPVNNPKLLPPASRTSAPIPIRRRYNATPASNNNNDELHKKIEKLQKELARIQKLAKKRFLKINALKKRVYRLQKSNLEQGNALVELLEKEE